MQISCLSPDERFEPFSEISYWRPPCSFKMFVSRAFLSSSSISLSSAAFSGSRLNLRVPENIVGSYGITVILLRTSSSGSFWISIPSMNIYPSKISTIRDIERQIVDLPAPVLPTTPIFSPMETLKDSLSSTTSVVGLYFNETLSNSILPCSGHYGLSFRKSRAPFSTFLSCGTFKMVKHLLTLTILAW